MTEHTENKYASVSPTHIKDLMAIYNDYLFMARQHEQCLRLTPLEELAGTQIESMYSGNFDFPWRIAPLDADEQQEFADFIENDIEGQNNRTYINLQHLKLSENNGKPPVLAIPPYRMTSINTQMPSLIERFTISFPNDATLGNTEFFIDGRYKASYTGKQAQNTPLKDCIADQELLTEFSVMINLSECFRQNDKETDHEFDRLSTNVYAAEMVAVNENNLLEILGSFAEKIQTICHEKYHMDDSQDEIKAAQQEGFLNLPDNFADYVNIRNFIRHQWDTLDDYEAFMPQKKNKKKDSKEVRAERINSYLKICDKPSLYQRMKAYIGALHHMQQIVAEINPDYFIRDLSESNTKFAARIKAAHRQNPDRQISVETNYPLASEKYEALNRNLRKILPDINIVDSFPEFDTQFQRMEDYKPRSAFLQAFNSIESAVIKRCVHHGKTTNDKGKKLKLRDAWNYMETLGILSADECQKWHDYTDLRNDLSHNYYNQKLKDELLAVQDEYYENLYALNDKLYEKAPIGTKKQKDVYACAFADGETYIIDYKNHTVKRETETPALAPEQHVQAQKSTPSRSRQNENTPTEKYPNNVEFTLSDAQINEVKLPSGIRINLQQQSISWNSQTSWYAGAQYFNALRTEKSKILTEKNLLVTEYSEKNRPLPFRGGDLLLLDFRHSVLLDSVGRLKEFKFKNADGIAQKTTFKHNKDERTFISFADGTTVEQSAKGFRVMHNNIELSYDTRQEFASTYLGSSLLPPQLGKSGNVR